MNSRDFYLIPIVKSISINENELDAPEHFEGIVLTGMIGSVKLVYLENEIIISDCPLLWFSRSMLRVVIFPILYSKEAIEYIPDMEISILGSLNLDNLIIKISKSSEDLIKIDSFSLDIAKSVGDFHRKVLKELFSRMPSVRNHSNFLVRYPDAFSFY